MRDRLWVVVGVESDLDRGVACIREKTPLAGLDGIEETFAGEAVAFDDAEAAAVESGAGGVAEPESVTGNIFVGVPDGDLLGVDASLHDRYESRLIFADSDGLLDVVREKFADLASASRLELDSR
jgi:hypothetical protein